MSIVPLSDVNPGSRQWTVCVYVSRRWHHRGGTDHGPIKHTDMVLLDAQGNHMYAEVPDDIVEKYMHRIEEGKVYKLKKFVVFPRKRMFRPVEAPYMIKFTRYTEVEEQGDSGVEYPFCTYNLTPLAQLPKPTDMPERFTDVMGIVSSVSEVSEFYSSSRTEPSVKRIITIKDLWNHEISVVLWGERATVFEADQVLALSEKEPAVALFVGTLVKNIDGQRGVSGSAACRWYINADLPEVHDLRSKLQADSLLAIKQVTLPGQTPAEIEAHTNLETKTVTQLLDMCIFENEERRFFSHVTVVRLNSSQNWWFISCTTCHKTANPYGTGYVCTNPQCAGNDALPRFCICCICSDGHNEAEFVFFDKVGRDLVGTPLINLLRANRPARASLTEIVESAKGDLSIPREIAAVVSQKLRLVVSVSKRSFTDEKMDKPSFQVHRIDAVLGKEPYSRAFYRTAGSVGVSGKEPNLTAPLSLLGSTSHNSLQPPLGTLTPPPQETPPTPVVPAERTGEKDALTDPQKAARQSSARRSLEQAFGVDENNSEETPKMAGSSLVPGSTGKSSKGAQDPPLLKRTRK